MTDNTEPPVDPLGQPTDGNNPLNSGTKDPNSTPPRFRNQRSWGIAVSCMLIIAAVAITQIPQYRNKRQSRQGVTRDLSLQLMGRYTVGMKSILGNTLAVERSIPQLKAAMEKSDNPRKQLFYIPISIELTAPQEAFTELERLASESDDDTIARDASVFLQLYQKGSNSLTPDQYRIIEQYGWTGELALSHDKPASDPLRRSVVRSALRTFVVVIFFVLGLLLALAAGLALFITAVFLWKKKRLKGRFSAPAATGESLLEAFAISITFLITLPALVTRSTLFTLPAVAFAILWPLIRGSTWKNVRTAIGWNRGRGILREIGAGIMGYLAGLPLLFLMLIPVMILTRSTGTVPAHPIVNEINQNPVTLVLLFGLACIWAPIVEETFFRGMLFAYLRRRWSWPVAGISTGFLFAVIHPQGWIAVPLLATIGFTLSAIREWRGSLIASITAHALNNGVVLFIVILMLA